MTEQDDARVELADAVRRLIAVVTTASAGAAGLDAARERVEAAIAALGPTPSATVHRAETESGRRRIVNPFDSPENPLAPPLRPVRCTDGEYVAEITLSPAYEGPPGRVHGGIVTGILDHASGFALAGLKIIAMSVSLTIELHDATPYGEPLTVTARMTEREGRRIWVEATLATADGQVTASCRTLMVELREPPAWAAAVYG